MGFMIYDLMFLAAFVLFVIVFLSTRKKNLTRQGILFLYKTQFGVRYIDKFAKKYKKILRPFQYVVLVSGYTLMAGILWLLIKTTYLYLTTSISEVIRAPPVAPLIPYFPRLFGLENFFPPLYFTYFIIALAIVAITHEAAHGIYARFYKFRVISTGFAFLGPILGAFVEPDEKQMYNAKKKPQLVVLAAGTFANVLMTILFGVILGLFFTYTFVPAGIHITDYSITPVNVDDIFIIGESSEVDGFIELEVNGKKFFSRQDALDRAEEKDLIAMFVIDDSPAFRSQVQGAIIEIDGQRIDSYESLSNSLLGYSPGDEIHLKTAIIDSGRQTVIEEREYDLILDDREGRAFMGVSFSEPSPRGLIGKVYVNTFAKIKEPLIHYESETGDLGWFVYYLLWWIVVINILVALFNMLPLGILDGGRFFYLTVWGLTGSEKIGSKAYKTVTWFLISLFLLMMIRWSLIFF